MEDDGEKPKSIRCNYFPGQDLRSWTLTGVPIAEGRNSSLLRKSEERQRRELCNKYLGREGLGPKGAMEKLGQWLFTSIRLFVVWGIYSNVIFIFLILSSCPDPRILAEVT